jgi:hypothetical protein
VPEVLKYLDEELTYLYRRDTIPAMLIRLCSKGIAAKASYGVDWLIPSEERLHLRVCLPDPAGKARGRETPALVAYRFPNWEMR